MRVSLLAKFHPVAGEARSMLLFKNLRGIPDAEI
jgi:hypothetical protein